jgi:hypothetical protein
MNKSQLVDTLAARIYDRRTTARAAEAMLQTPARTPSPSESRCP